MKLFHFEVYAVMVTEHDSDGNPETPELLGFWPNREAADAYVQQYDADRFARVKAQQESWNQRFGINREATPLRFDYNILPASDVMVDGRWPLNSLEEKLVLMATGTAVTRCS